MSIFNVPTGSVEEINVAITANTATTIADGTDNTLYVAWFEVNGHTTDTPALTVDIYDGTNARYLGDDDLNVAWNARTAGAKSSYPFTKGYVVPKGSKIRVTSDDAAGKFHVHGVLYRQP
jgi:hypothetical protein